MGQSRGLFIADNGKSSCWIWSIKCLIQSCGVLSCFPFPPLSSPWAECYFDTQLQAPGNLGIILAVRSIRLARFFLFARFFPIFFSSILSGGGTGSPPKTVGSPQASGIHVCKISVAKTALDASLSLEGLSGCLVDSWQMLCEAKNSSPISFCLPFL